MSTKYQLIESAKSYIRIGNISNAEYNNLYPELVNEEQFGYANEILLLWMDKNKDSIVLKNYQQLARNTYKDTTLSSYFKFDKALDILIRHGALETTVDCETLGLAGAIYKNKWKFDNQFKHLFESRAYYKKGYESWLINSATDVTTETDRGYTAINCAYINELIVIENLEQLSKTTGITEETVRKFNYAKEIREKIIETYIDVKVADAVQMKYELEGPLWLYATLAEAYFGIRDYDRALHFINKFVKDKNSKWQLKTFTQQLYDIASFQATEKKYCEQFQKDCFDSKAISESGQIKCLRALNIKPEEKSNQEKVYESRKKGKLGIGLSGGGFRAALFHIGVLAGLAEQDTLKDLELLSCVSGGSIIGTHYYLKLKVLLETKTDDEITKQDYIELIQQLEEEFLAAVQQNMRVMIFADLGKNISMLDEKEYSRTHRLGEIYEELLYLPVINKYNKEMGLELQKALALPDLLINPKNETDFNIYDDNWKRKNKVPQLVLNATTLNTGHNWQFTATWMGEPPTYISDNLDAKPRLRRMYFKGPKGHMPEKYERFRLGYAVAASSGVPVLFEPLPIEGLYEDIHLELVDGGVHDNQGIASILEQECSNVIISDGSSQMTNNYKEVGNEFSVFYRADSILQERVREIQLLDMKSRLYSSMIYSLTIVHLKNGLSHPPINWIGCDEPEKKILTYLDTPRVGTLLNYGIEEAVQELISKIRTDLDSHNDLESYALMYSGYKQIMCTNPQAVGTVQWKFLQIQNNLNSKKLERQLEISQSVFFKITKLSKPLNYFISALALLILLGVVVLFIMHWKDPRSLYCLDLTYKIIGTALIVFIAGLFLKYVPQLLKPKNYVKNKTIRLALVVVGFLGSKLYLLTLNKLYNRLGKL